LGEGKKNTERQTTSKKGRGERKKKRKKYNIYCKQTMRRTRGGGGSSPPQRSGLRKDAEESAFVFGGKRRGKINRPGKFRKSHQSDLHGTCKEKGKFSYLKNGLDMGGEKELEVGYPLDKSQKGGSSVYV